MSIANLKTIPVSGKINNKFVGIKIEKNEINFYYPETYILSENTRELRKQILAVLRTISLAKTKSNSESTYYTNFVKNEVFPLSSYLWIINDYLKNRRYENKEKQYIKGIAGKINWKKTLNSNPIISNGNIIYTEFISENKSQKDNLLTEVYLYCVAKAIEAIGWLYNLSFTAFESHNFNTINNRKSIYLVEIKKELMRVFDDNKRIRLNHMKNIILGLDDNLISSNSLIYGVESYEYVYEKLINSMFSNIKDIREFYPSSSWILEPNKKVFKSSNLRPDTIIKSESKYYIIDAKYYRYGVTFSNNDMPDTTSIQKQITYGEYLKMIKKDCSSVYNVFLLPYSKKANIYNDVFKNNIEFVGVAKAKWIKDGKDTSKNIGAFLIDTNYLIDNWMYKNCDNINSLIKEIEINLGGYGDE